MLSSLVYNFLGIFQILFYGSVLCGHPSYVVLVFHLWFPCVLALFIICPEFGCFNATNLTVLPPTYSPQTLFTTCKSMIPVFTSVDTRKKLDRDNFRKTLSTRRIIINGLRDNLTSLMFWRDFRPKTRLLGLEKYKGVKSLLEKDPTPGVSQQFCWEMAFAHFLEPQVNGAL